MSYNSELQNNNAELQEILDEVDKLPVAVSTEPQNLTEAQKAQARENIGAVGKNNITVGFHTDGLLYVFVDGYPVGNGVALPSGESGDVVGNVDSENNIIVTGNLPDGTYTVKYEMEDGSTVDIGDLVIDRTVYYSVTNKLTNCTNGNNATRVAEGESYSATITAHDGYELSSVVVTMGGTNVSVTNGVINIANVTGDIVITAVAEVSGPAYTNQIPLSIGTDGKPFNDGKGYKTGYRLSLSGGSESQQDGTEVTGFIPVAQNSVIRIKNIAYEGDTIRGVVGYDANFNKLTTGNGVAIAHMFVDHGFDDGNGVRRSNPMYYYTHLCTDALKYIRLCSTEITDNSIITVDEPIV